MTEKPEPNFSCNFLSITDLAFTVFPVSIKARTGISVLLHRTITFKYTFLELSILFICSNKLFTSFTLLFSEGPGSTRFRTPPLILKNPVLHGHHL